MRRIVTAVSALALAFSMVSLAGPANAAVAGYDSQYAGESAFLSLSPGGTGTFTAFFANTGTTTWVKGSASQVDLAGCRSDKVSCGAGPDPASAPFNPGTWPSSVRYASQSQATVAPGQIGTFTYNVTVPATALPQTYRFNGAAVLSATGADIHNEGYYQDLTVTVITTIAITSCGTSPTSASSTTVTGTGAGAAASVTIKDGGAQVAVTTADSTGAFSASVTGLTSGAHSFTASTPQQTSAACALTVDTTKPQVSSASASPTQITVTFNRNMSCASLASGTYTVKDISATIIDATSPSGGGASQISAVGVSTSTTGTADCLQATLSLTNALTNGVQYTLTVVSGVTDAAGNTIDTTANTATFVAIRGAAPTLSSAAYRSSTVVRLTFSSSMNASTVASATTAQPFGTSILNPANYTVDGTAGTAYSAACTAGPSPVVWAECTLSAGTGFTTASHTFTAGNVADASGTLISPNPTSTAASYPPTTTRPTVSSVTAPNLVQIVVQYVPAPGATMIGGGCLTIGFYQLQSASGAAIYTGTTWPAGTSISGCSSTTNAGTITLPAGSTLTASTTYSLVISGVTDSFRNNVNPNPTAPTFTTGATATPIVSSTSTTTSTSTNPCPSAATGQGATTGPCNQTMFTVTYNVPMGSTAVTSGNYSFGAANTFGLAGATVSPALCLGGSTDGTTFTADTSNVSVVCTLNTPIQKGGYTLTITGVLGRDGTALASPTTTSVTFADTTRPTVTAAAAQNSGTANASTVTVTFSEAMNQSGGPAGATSVTNPANYVIDSTALSTSNTVSLTCSLATACTVVTITLTGGPNTTVIATAGTTHSVTVTGVTDIAGNVVNPSPSARSFNTT